MAIAVRTEYETDYYPESTKWHVDEKGYLHVLKQGGNAATYPHETWNAVFDYEPAVAGPAT